MRKRSLIAIITILIGASLVFTWSTSAHSIDLKTAREAARNYARGVRDQSGGKYAHYSTSCVKAFPGHNHYVRCSIFYFDESRKQLCKERIEVYLPEHHMAKFPDLGTVQELTYNLKHTSTKEC